MVACNKRGAPDWLNAQPLFVLSHFQLGCIGHSKHIFTKNTPRHITLEMRFNNYYLKVLSHPAGHLWILLTKPLFQQDVSLSEPCPSFLSASLPAAYLIDFFIQMGNFPATRAKQTHTHATIIPVEKERERLLMNHL